MEEKTVRPGRHAPLGATFDGQGVNFAVFSESATGMDVCLFDENGVEQRVLPLPQAVHKMTGMPARRLRLRDRGIIREGARADLVVFDARRIADTATYEDPHRYPAGIEHVLVNGRFVIKHGEHTGSLPGRVLTPP